MTTAPTPSNAQRYLSAARGQVSIGPVINTPIRTQAQVDNIRALDSEKELPFIKEILGGLRSEVGDKATVLGFVGAPWTLATYLVEGKGTEDYAIIKAMAYKEPDLLHQLLSKLADAIGLYACYQIDSGAQAIQLFDSWAGQLSPLDYQTFALPYEKRIVETIKREHHSPSRPHRPHSQFRTRHPSPHLHRKCSSLL